MMQISPLQGGDSYLGMPIDHALTSDQLDQVSSILSNYDPESLSEEDSEAIRQAFREAGIAPGEDLRQAIEDAGFDAESIRGSEGGPRQGPPPPPQQGQSLSSLSQLKDILSEYDLSNLDSEGVASLNTALQESGLLQSGLSVNISI